jgi:hypothetical protein
MRVFLKAVKIGPKRKGSHFEWLLLSKDRFWVG